MLSSSSGRVVTIEGENVVVLPISGTGAVENVAVSGGTITPGVDAVSGLTQPITGDRTLAGINGGFIMTNALSGGGEMLTLGFQLWTSSNQTNSFLPVPGATCATSVDPYALLGSVSHCTATGLSIPLANETQAILVVDADHPSGLSSGLFGYWSAGLQLS